MKKNHNVTTKGEDTDKALASAGSAGPDLNEDSQGLHDSIISEKDEIKEAEEQMRRRREAQNKNTK